MGLSKKVWHSDLDLNKYELLQARLENLASAPGTPGLGQVYFDTVLDHFYGKNAGAFRQLDATLLEHLTDITATAAEVNLLDIGSSTEGWALLINSGGTTATWKAIPIGATSWIGLSDTDEADYTGHAGQLVRVNSTPDGLEFATATLANSATDINATAAELNVWDLSATALTVGWVYAADGASAASWQAIDMTMLTGTMAEFDTAVSDGTFVWAGDTSISGWGFYIDDDTFSTANATTFATSESIKAYVDNAVVGGMIYKGAEDASTAPPTGAGILVGWTYTVTVAGNGGGFWTIPKEIGDVIIVESTNPATEADWTEVSRDLPAGVTFKYAESIGNGSLTTIPVTHNLNSKDITVSVHRVASPFDEIECQVEKTSTTVVTLDFNTAPTSAEFRVTVIG